ncbi:DUF2628 domain-containing protein [Pectobacterium cacticida]|uniref:DUF2628 domain-containing protein n=1 Tax=Pectobacterium cacticida TaxID=69221 RepID=UPI00398570F2
MRSATTGIDAINLKTIPLNYPAINTARKFGAPNTATFKNGCKNATFRTRMLLKFNFIAFFFSIIYFFVLGLWRKNLTLLGISLVIATIFAYTDVYTSISLPIYTESAVRTALSLMWALTTNHAYYLKQIQGSKSWNPFEGMF